MTLSISSPYFLDAYEMEDASVIWQNNCNCLIASNRNWVFVIDLENAFCHVLAERKSLSPLLLHLWRYHLPKLMETHDTRVVCSDNFGMLMQKRCTDCYWICNEGRRALFEPMSRCREILGVVVLDAKFLRGPNESVVFLMDNQELIVDPFKNWFCDTPQQYVTVIVAAEKIFSHILTDALRNIVIFGEKNVAVYSSKLRLKWQQAFEKKITTCWLSKCTFWIFCLFADGLVQTFDRDTGKPSISATGFITPIATTATQGTDCTILRPWNGKEISMSTRVFPKNSIRGDVNSFYIVSQPENSSITQIHEMKIVINL